MQIKCLASGSSGNSFLISDGKTNLLLDCGIPYKQIQKKTDFARIDACLITHEHQDHCKAIKDVLKYGTEVWLPYETFKELDIKHYNVRPLEALNKLGLFTFVITPFFVEHDVPCMGFQIYSMITKETLVYITDTAYCKYKFKGINYFIVECNYVKSILDKNTEDKIIDQSLRNRIVQSHMSLETLKDLLIANGIDDIKEIYLTHLSSRNSDSQVILEEVQKLTGKVVHVCG